jgi:toxin-antitoxin system PIN domain toxin
LILVDANILLYAENVTTPQHSAARAWWDRQLSGTTPVCLCWPVINAFIRIATNHRAFVQPLTIDQANHRVQSWLDQPCVRVVGPTEHHWLIFRDLLRQAQAVANLVADAHIAAISIENGCELCSTDADFARFPKLRWNNPL